MIGMEVQGTLHDIPKGHRGMIFPIIQGSTFPQSFGGRR